MKFENFEKLGYEVGSEGEDYIEFVKVDDNEENFDLGDVCVYADGTVQFHFSKSSKEFFLNYSILMALEEVMKKTLSVINEEENE